MLKKLQKNSESKFFKKWGIGSPLTEDFLLFCFHRKIVDLKFDKNLGICSPHPRLFYFSHFHHILNFFKFFSTKTNSGHHTISFETSLVEIEHNCWQKT